jgi:hypothetical protein
MTKAQLEQKIAQLESDNNLLRNEVCKLEKAKKMLIDNTQDEISRYRKLINEQAYQDWKKVNAEFTKRYVAELLRDGFIGVKVEASEGGYIDVDLTMYGETFATATDKVCLERGLGEW